MKKLMSIKSIKDLKLFFHLYWESYKSKSLIESLYKLLFAWQNQMLYPSQENQENFWIAKADVKGEFLDRVWSPYFEKYWEEIASSEFVQMSSRSVLKFRPSQRKGTHLSLVGLLNAFGKEEEINSKSIWVNPKNKKEKYDMVAKLNLKKLF